MRPHHLRYAFIAICGLVMAWPWLMGHGLSIAPPWLILAIFMLGMPHGALDLLFAHRALHRQSWQAWLGFLLGYVLFAACILLCWWWLPTLSLGLFLLLSAYHFADDLDHTLAWYWKAMHGLLVISLPAIQDADALARLYQLVSASPAIGTVVSVSRVCAWCALAGAMLALGVSRWQQSALPESRQWLVMLSAWGLMLTTPALLAFTIYFCVLHSPQHLLRTQTFLRVALRDCLRWPVWLASVLVCLLAGAWLVHASAHPLPQGMIAITFPLLASLTYPHVWLLHRTRFSFRHGV